MTKILVVGGMGFIGRYLCDALRLQGSPITVLDNMSGHVGMPVWNHGVKYIHGDVRDEKLVASLVQDNELIFNLASPVGHIRVTFDPREAFDVNIQGTFNILKHATFQRIVMFSSPAVYGIGDLLNFSEKDKPTEGTARLYDGGKTGYAAGKQLMETMCINSDRNVIIVRPCNVVGPGQDGACGMVFPRFIARAILCEPLTVYDDGLQSRGYSDVHTFVRVLLDILRGKPPSKSIFNIGSTYAISVWQLIRAMEIAFERPIKTEFRPYAGVFNKKDVFTRIPDMGEVESLVGRIVWPSLLNLVDEMYLYMRSLTGYQLRRHAGMYNV